MNHYQRRTRLKDVEQAVFEVESRNENGTCETIRFPALDICGEVSFFLPYKMDLAGAELTWATAQPLCREGNTFFFLEIPGMEPVYCLDGEEFSVKTGREAFRILEKKISIVTLNLSDARFLRRLDGKLYLGEGCDLYLEDETLRSVEAGEQKAFVWENGAFPPCSVQAEETGCEEAPRLTAETGDVSCRSNDSVCMLTKLSDSPFTLTGPGLEEVLLSAPGPLDWYRLTVPDPYGFVLSFLRHRSFTPMARLLRMIFITVFPGGCRRSLFPGKCLHCHHNNRTEYISGTSALPMIQIPFPRKNSRKRILKCSH